MSATATDFSVMIGHERATTPFSRSKSSFRVYENGVWRGEEPPQFWGAETDAKIIEAVMQGETAGQIGSWIWTRCDYPGA